MGKESPVRADNGLDNGSGDLVRDNGSAGNCNATPDCHAQGGRQRHIARPTAWSNRSGHDHLKKDVSYMPSELESSGDRCKGEGRWVISKLSSFSTLCFSEQVCEFCV